MRMVCLRFGCSGSSRIRLSSKCFRLKTQCQSTYFGSTVRRASVLYSLKEIFYSPNCYAVLKIDYDDSQVYTTKVVKGSDEPRWNEHFDVFVTPYSKFKSDP